MTHRWAWPALHTVAIAVALSGCGGAEGQPDPVDVRLYGDGDYAVWGRAALDGVAESAVPAYDDATLRGYFQGLEIYDRVPNRDSWPLTLVNLLANGFVRVTYQAADGSSGSLGTSVAATFSYRTPGGLQYVPTGTSAEIYSNGRDRLRIVRHGQFGSDAVTRSTCSFPDPPIGRSTASLTTRFEARRAIALDPGQVGNDAFRLLGLSSMFANAQHYDADAIRWRAEDGIERVLQLSDTTPRDAHLFPAPVVIPVGGHFELAKHRGGAWNPSSPCIRIDLLSVTGIAGRFGVQGWLADSPDPSDDSLTLWLEWIDAPAIIPAGAVYEARFTATATPPREP